MDVLWNQYWRFAASFQIPVSAEYGKDGITKSIAVLLLLLLLLHIAFTTITIIVIIIVIMDNHLHPMSDAKNETPFMMSFRAQISIPLRSILHCTIVTVFNNGIDGLVVVLVSSSGMS